MPVMRRRSERSRAASQRAREAAARAAQEREAAARPNNIFDFDRFATEFERDMRSIDFVLCSSCRKRTVNSDLSRTRCYSCNRSRNNLFCAANGMDIGGIPFVLQGLTLIEQILIARVHPVVSVFKIRGQQRGYSGHVMNFVQHIEYVATRMPPSLSNITSIVLLDRETPHGLIQFRVRSQRVRDALIWLKDNNQYYRDITIDEDVIASLPVDGDAVEHLPIIVIPDEPQVQQQPPEEDGNNIIDRSCFPNIPAVNADEVIAQNLRRVELSQGVSAYEIGEWPDISQEPEDEFRSEGLICKAFPCLFPYGRGDLHAPRLHNITKHKYFKYLMQYEDGRFANDERFPYYAYNSLARWDALNAGNVYIRSHALEGLSAEDISAIANDPNQDIAANIMYYGANLRGTRSYWKQRCSELLQMVRQIGPPTIFFTLSAADYHWVDLFRILLPGLNIAAIDDKMRHTVMHDNPATVAWFFEIRVSIFMKKFVEKFFKVKDFWYRYEWQHRGSPHVHGLLWLDNAPDCTDINSLAEEARHEITRYFDHLVTASISRRFIITPNTNPCRQRYTDLSSEEKAVDLDKILSAVQRHSRHGSYCMRRNRVTRRMACRFGFPIQEEAESSLRNENGRWKFIPKRNDPLLQRYNPHVSQIWRGNTDFSAITSKDDVLNYVSKYASKAEHASEAYTDVLRRIISRNPSDTPAATLVRKLLISSVAERNFSAQEVMQLLMGWPLYHSSRSTVTLSLRDDWRRIQSRTSTIVSRYPTRSGDLDEVSLFVFAKKYRLESNRTITRRKDCIVRVIPFLKLSDDPIANEEYYKLECKLHIPWRGIFENILPDGMSWEELYLTRVLEPDHDLDSFGYELPRIIDEEEFENAVASAEDIVREAGMAASRLHPGLAQDDPIGHRPIDEAFVWHDMPALGISDNDVRSFLRSFRNAPATDSARQSAIEFINLTSAQQEVVEICHEQFSNPACRTKRVLVQGKAGTGKSAVIKAICQYLDDCCNSADDFGKIYKVLAPTGAAAVNINGETIHSFFRIPINGQLLPLNGENLRNFQLQFRQLKYIIIDEYSMIGLRLLNKIHRRLCEAKGCGDEPFGGYNIYLFGDLRQLPPVRDIAIYMDPSDDFSRYALSLIASIQMKIILTVSHRQSASQIQFKEVLDSLAVGNISRDGWQLLMSRRVSITPSNMDQFSGAINLFPTNNQVAEHNARILANNRQAVASIEAEHNNATARQGSEVNAGGLSRKLYLSLGSRVILRKNLCVHKGLVNGSMGTIRDIVYYSDSGPPALPAFLLIEFDRYPGPFFQETVAPKLFPLLPITKTWKDQGVDCSRKQFPINLAYALTIHKAQGMTLEKVTIDIGEKETTPGLTYVALSRVRKLTDLLIAKPFNYSRVASIGQMRQVVAREAFLRDMESN